MNYHFKSLNVSKIILVTFAGLCLHNLTMADEHVDPENDGSQHAFAANLDWVNAEPSGDGGPGIGFIDTKVVGWLWSANAGWVSLNCINTNTCGDVDYGIKHDGAGNLSGYAWAANLGWVSFSCADSKSCDDVDYSVTVDLETGEMAGYAYAANVGWIGLSCNNTGSCGAVDFGVRVDVDSVNGNLLSDSFEDL